ncbi:ATP-dependent DNA helicase [Evansella sp. AB-rgal1]|uniref:ATP-dependent DNA helicase n=1 Tax=Evansella sp. AB-rgal1 TaxID=3242696 RepID=UPI00359CDDB4
MTSDIHVSVRSLVEYVYSSGSIDTALPRRNSVLIDGVKTHQRLQKLYKEGDLKEVHLTCSVEYEDIEYVLEGRCDGILFDDGVTIDEIKSSQTGVDHIDEEANKYHWGQAKLYGYMYARKEELPEIHVQVTYADVHSEKMKASKRTYTFSELEKFTYELIDEYSKYASLRLDFEKKKIESIKQLAFPFSRYRKGQRDLAVATYKTIVEDKKLFVKAPTGIGKTISTIFPSVKAMGEGIVRKLIYVTAKTITRTVAEETFSLLREKGLRMKVCTITAKDKVCFKDETICQKDYCEFANGYYDRINGAILDILEKEDSFNRVTIERYAKKHTVCPFEFSLDIALLSDSIICDYNYVFDPRVALKRLSMDNKNSYVLLVDEAHNLVERARSMYSASIHKSSFLNMKRLFSTTVKEISSSASQINELLLKLKKEEIIEQYTTRKEMIGELSELLQGFVDICDEWIPRNQQEKGFQELLDVYFEANMYLKIANIYDDSFITYMEQNQNDVKIKLVCLHPGKLLKENTKNYRGTLFFSATLIPGNYYLEMLGGSSEDYTLALSSPFDPNNVDLSIANLSTRYKDRDATFEKIIDLIYEDLSRAKGNFLIFFPSYQYMNAVYDKFTIKYPSVKSIIQENIMDEENREEFLHLFQEDNKKALIGFAVLGGIFSEGIDLKGDRLTGVIIVGVGLPQLNSEQDMLKEYFRSLGKNGFDYAYVYPGISKVLQAAGRLIRTETDKGRLLLIDDRFLTEKYQRLLPNEWKQFNIIN